MRERLNNLEEFKALQEKCMEGSGLLRYRLHSRRKSESF